MTAPLPVRCVHELVSDRAAADPDAVAVLHPHGRLTYAELDRRANRLARLLRRSGAGPEELVGVLLPRGADAVVALLAVLRAGAAYLPLDPDDPPARRDALLAGSGVRLALADVAVPAGIRVVREADAAGLPDTAPATGVHPDNLAYVMFTSGSTGRPKGVQITHRNVVRLVRGAADYVRLGPGAVLSQLAPLAFDAATFEVWAALGTGAAVAVPEPGVPTAAVVRDTVRRYGVTALWLTVGLFHQIARTDPDALRGAGHVLTGGDVVSPALVRAVLERGVRVSAAYGPTECTTFTSVHPELSVADTAGPVPIGRPVRWTTVRVAGAGGDPAAAGELLVGGAGVARGYLGDPAATAARFVPDPDGTGARAYRTGDLVGQDPDGLLHFRGRLDTQLKIRGHRVEPAEVEAALAAHPDIAAAAVGPAGAAGDRQLAGYLVLAPDRPRPAPAQLRAFLRDRLPEALVPTAWAYRDTLPLTANGKLDRAALGPPDPVGPAGRDGPPPRTPVERAVAEVWAEVLDTDRIDAHSDFFGLGGHSLLATRVVSLLAERFPVSVPVRAVFEAPTVELLAAEVTALVAEHVAGLSDEQADALFEEVRS